MDNTQLSLLLIILIVAPLIGLGISVIVNVLGG